MSAKNSETLKCPVEHMRSPEKFNPFSSEFIQDPQSAFMSARDEQPVFFSPVMNLWVVTRYEDLKTVMKDVETFTSGGAFSSASLASPEALKMLGGLNHPVFAYSLVNVDPPVHPRFRNSFQRVFTSRQVSILEPQIRDLTHQLLAELKEKKRAEFINSFCDQLPLLTICRLMGVPDVDAPSIKRWSTDSIRAQIPGWSIEQQREIGQSILDYYEYMLELVKHYADNPAENLISAMIQTRQSDREPLTYEEIAGLTFNLVLAGHETTAALIGNTLYMVLKQPQLWDYICQNPEGIGAAVDEFIRHGGSAVGLYRRTSRDVVLGEVTIPKDSNVWITYLAGNYDPEQFPNPNELLLDRPNASNHLSFGHGIHFCVGAALAKLELRVVLEELSQSYPSLRLEPDQTIAPVPNFVLRSYQQMVLVID